jgi:hypothetical protein
VVLDRNYPAWLGWAGFLGGLGSLVAGVMMFLGTEILPEWVFIVFALIVSLFMLIMGALMWRNAPSNRAPAPVREQRTTNDT